mmetsp:Transcript_31613/g.79605  ORF Transcript_31613/g.79605 Transcript_31613/m.79605 type:complete len:233 (-) Transcript_31613:1064-1762(-)
MRVRSRVRISPRRLEIHSVNFHTPWVIGQILDHLDVLVLKVVVDISHRVTLQQHLKAHVRGSSAAVNADISLVAVAVACPRVGLYAVLGACDVTAAAGRPVGAAALGPDLTLCRPPTVRIGGTSRSGGYADEVRGRLGEECRERVAPVAKVVVSLPLLPHVEEKLLRRALDAADAAPPLEDILPQLPLARWRAGVGAAILGRDEGGCLGKDPGGGGEVATSGLDGGRSCRAY